MNLTISFNPEQFERLIEASHLAALLVAFALTLFALSRWKS